MCCQIMRHRPIVNFSGSGRYVVRLARETAFLGKCDLTLDVEDPREERGFIGDLRELQVACAIRGVDVHIKKITLWCRPGEAPGVTDRLRGLASDVVFDPGCRNYGRHGPKRDPVPGEESDEEPPCVGDSLDVSVQGPEVIEFPRSWWCLDESWVTRMRRFAWEHGASKFIDTLCPRHNVGIVSVRPFSVLTYLIRRVKCWDEEDCFPPQRLVGLGCMLETARLRALIARELEASVADVQAMVIGGDAPELMVPLVRHASVAGVPLTRLLPADRIEMLAKRAIEWDDEPSENATLPTPVDACSAAVAELVDCILNDRRRLLPLSAYCRGEYGIRGMYMAVPAVLGARGVERVVELELTEDEAAVLRRAAEVTRRFLRQKMRMYVP